MTVEIVERSASLVNPVVGYSFAALRNHPASRSACVVMGSFFTGGVVVLVGGEDEVVAVVFSGLAGLEGLAGVASLVRVTARGVSEEPSSSFSPEGRRVCSRCCEKKDKKKRGGGI